MVTATLPLMVGTVILAPLIASTTEIGKSAQILGAGRAKKEDIIDLTAGIYVAKKTGDFIKKGDLLATLQTSRPETLADAEACYRGALSWGDTAPESRPLVYKIV